MNALFNLLRLETFFFFFYVYSFELVDTSLYVMFLCSVKIQLANIRILLTVIDNKLGIKVILS